MKKAIAVVFMGLLLMQPGLAAADNISRDYIPAPPGCLAVLLYYQNVSADSLYADGDEMPINVDFSGNIGLFRPVYYTKIGPFTADPQFILPFGNLDLDIDGTSMSSTGIGDPIVLATVWFVNRPESMTWLGFSPFFFIPVGDYDNEGALSLGENRWRFREELGFVKGFEVVPGHKIYLELTGGVDFFTTNDDFGPNSQELDQDPLFNLEAHISYDVTETFFVSGDYYSHYGGETSVDDVDRDDSANTQTLGMTLGFGLAPSYQLLFQYKGDVSQENGLGTQTFTARLLYACDVGHLFGKPKK